MEKNDTIILVGVTETDSYGNLWVTPQGGGDRIKIGEKRKQLHPIFQQGKAVLLHWETYKNKPYVADAKLVEGELPLPVKPVPVGIEPPKPDTGKPQRQYGRDEDRVDERTFVMEVGDDLRAGLIDKTHPFVKARETILATWVNLKIEVKPEPQPAPIEALRPTNVVNVEDLRIKLQELFNAVPKKVDGRQLVGWGIKKWADMDTLPQEKLLEIAKAVEKI